jgi:hypothetical protein
LSLYNPLIYVIGIVRCLVVTRVTSVPEEESEFPVAWTVVDAHCRHSSRAAGRGMPEFEEITGSPIGPAYAIVRRFKAWGTQTSSSGTLVARVGTFEPGGTMRGINFRSA